MTCTCQSFSTQLPFSSCSWYKEKNIEGKPRGVQSSDKNQTQHILQGFRAEVCYKRVPVSPASEILPPSNLPLVAWNCSETDLFNETRRIGILHFLNDFLCGYKQEKCCEESRQWKRSCQSPDAKRHPSSSYIFTVSLSCRVDRKEDGRGSGSRDHTWGLRGCWGGVSLYLSFCDHLGILWYGFNFSFDSRRSSFLLLNHGIMHFIISTA